MHSELDIFAVCRMKARAKRSYILIIEINGDSRSCFTRRLLKEIENIFCVSFELYKTGESLREL